MKNKLIIFLVLLLIIFTWYKIYWNYIFISKDSFNVLKIIKNNWYQELILKNWIKITNSYTPSHVVCYNGITNIIENWEEKKLLEYIKDSCAIDVVYVKQNIIKLPICYGWWWWSWECSLLNLNYNIKTKKWYFEWTEYYISDIISSNKILLNEYFDISFFKFISYFDKKYFLNNKEQINNLYIDKSWLLNLDEKEILINTINQIWEDFSNNKLKILYWLWNQIIKNKNLDEKTIAKLHYIILLDVNDLSDFNTKVEIDYQIKEYIDNIIFKK